MKSSGIHLLKICGSSFLLGFLTLIGSTVLAFEPDSQATMESSEKLFDSMEKSAEDVFASGVGNMEAEWSRMEAAEEKKWKDLEHAVLKKWSGYRETTKKVWVNYDDDHKAVSQVNFETGIVVVEALLPKGATAEQQASALKKKIENLKDARDADGKSVMVNLLPHDIAASIPKLAEQIEKPTLVHGRDGVDRLKVGVTVSMVPDHLARQAKNYLSTVNAAAQANGLEPALILAIIHTESAFNPMARSSVPAFGLMQIVPRHAGKDAYRQLYGKVKILPPEYLYKPNNNILIGVTYLEQLFNTHFKEIKDRDKQRYFVICAYNWGPTAVRKKIVDKIDSKQLGASQVREYLLAHVPAETHNYLIKVEERRQKYAAQM